MSILSKTFLALFILGFSIVIYIIIKINIGIFKLGFPWSGYIDLEFRLLDNYKRNMRLKMDLKEGQKYLDLGAGIAHIVNYISHDIGPRGELVLIEADRNCARNVELNRDMGHHNYLDIQ